MRLRKNILLSILLTAACALPSIAQIDIPLDVKAPKDPLPISFSLHTSVVSPNYFTKAEEQWAEPLANKRIKYDDKQGGIAWQLMLNYHLNKNVEFGTGAGIRNMFVRSSEIAMPDWSEYSSYQYSRGLSFLEIPAMMKYRHYFGEKFTLYAAGTFAPVIFMNGGQTETRTYKAYGEQEIKTGFGYDARRLNAMVSLNIGAEYAISPALGVYIQAGRGNYLGKLWSGNLTERVSFLEASIGLRFRLLKSEQ
jgi:hypothetical protein